MARQRGAGVRRWETLARGLIAVVEVFREHGDALIAQGASIRNLWTATIFHRSEIAEIKDRVARLEAIVTESGEV